MAMRTHTRINKDGSTTRTVRYSNGRGGGFSTTERIESPEQILARRQKEGFITRYSSVEMIARGEITPCDDYNRVKNALSSLHEFRQEKTKKPTLRIVLWVIIGLAFMPLVFPTVIAVLRILMMLKKKPDEKEMHDLERAIEIFQEKLNALEPIYMAKQEQQKREKMNNGTDL